MAAHQNGKARYRPDIGATHVARGRFSDETRHPPADLFFHAGHHLFDLSHGLAGEALARLGRCRKRPQNQDNSARTLVRVEAARVENRCSWKGPRITSSRSPFTESVA